MRLAVDVTVRVWVEAEGLMGDGEGLLVVEGVGLGVAGVEVGDTERLEERVALKVSEREVLPEAERDGVGVREAEEE